MLTRLIIATVVVLILALGADRVVAQELPEVQPFRDVQDSEFVFENDPTFPGRGIFRVSTTEPMICAIVWGETEELGNFNNSLAMSGTGIIEHDVILPGAEAGKTYFFRVQGSTADGSLYSSELSTFTLPDVQDSTPEAETDHGTNVAEGATVVDVSSEFGESWSAANAVDGDLSTEWSSEGDGDSSYITIDLGASYDITGVEFLTRSMADGSSITETYFIVLEDGERMGPFEAGNPADTNFTPVEFSGQIVRFEVETTTGGNTGAIEIRAFSTDLDG